MESHIHKELYSESVFHYGFLGKCFSSFAVFELQPSGLPTIVMESLVVYSIYLHVILAILICRGVTTFIFYKNMMCMNVGYEVIVSRDNRHHTYIHT